MTDSSLSLLVVYNEVGVVLKIDRVVEAINILTIAVDYFLTLLCKRV